MTSTHYPIVDSYIADDSRIISEPAALDRNSPMTLRDNSSHLDDQNFPTNQPLRRMTDLNSQARTPTNSQRSQNSRARASTQPITSEPRTTKSRRKRSRSSSPFPAISEAPPEKKRMSIPPPKPWIKNEDLFQEIQKKLSLYGLGPYDIEVASDKWLPFNIQSKILNRVQNVLEEALFEFLESNWPETCRENGWEEMGEAELNELAPAMLTGMESHEDTIEQFINPSHPQIASPLPELLSKIGQIRHCAVHRTKKIPVIILEFMVRDASYITTYISDVSRTNTLDDLCRPLEPLSFNLQARFGDKLKGKVQRMLQRTQTEVEKLREALRIAEEKEKQTSLHLEEVFRQDEGTYEGRLDVLRESL